MNSAATVVNNKFCLPETRESKKEKKKEEENAEMKTQTPNPNPHFVLYDCFYEQFSFSIYRLSLK